MWKAKKKYCYINYYVEMLADIVTTGTHYAKLSH